MEGKTMKKFVRIMSVALVVVMLCATLASCGKVSGAYSAKIDVLLASVEVTYDFGAFGKVEMTVKGEALGTTDTKTYEGGNHSFFAGAKQTNAQRNTAKYDACPTEQKSQNTHCDIQGDFSSPMGTGLPFGYVGMEKTRRFA